MLAHGFTQTSRGWGTFGATLARARRVLAVDLPGHGGSGGVRADLETTAALLGEAVERAWPDGAYDLCGYSLGGRVALHLALAGPARLRRLVLLSTTAGIDDEAARAVRRRRDGSLADDLERDGDVGGFVARWLAAPLFATLAPEAAGAAERATNTAGGLAASLRMAGTGTQRPLWDRLGQLTVPVLVVAGATDPRFVALGRRLADGLGAGVLSVVPGAGHAVHLEQPRLCARLVGCWLDGDLGDGPAEVGDAA